MSKRAQRWRRWVVIAAGILAGCGDDSAGNEGSGSGTAGDTAAMGCECPATPPDDGDACHTCEGYPACAWEECGGAGVSTALCFEGNWSVSAEACGDWLCEESDVGTPTICMTGQACVVYSGGAASPPECAPHQCGSGPITCECAVPSCGAGCSRTGPMQFHCGTCPEGNCP